MNTICAKCLKLIKTEFHKVAMALWGINAFWLYVYHIVHSRVYQMATNDDNIQHNVEKIHIP
jgi:hypothetical protein